MPNGTRSLYDITPGTVTGEKAIIPNKNKVIDYLDVTAFYIGSTQVTSTAAELNALDGITATVAELNLTDGQLASISFVVGAEAANVINVALQFKDAAGSDMAVRSAVLCYLSADANGDAIGTAPSVGTSIGTDGLLIEWTANVAGLLVSESDGDADLDLEEAGALTNYLVCVLPTGLLTASGAITHAA